MSFTRYNWPRKHCEGESNLYSFIHCGGFIQLDGDKLEALMVEKEDFLEMILGFLHCSGVEVDEEEVKKMAEYLEVELREQPLSGKERIELMEEKEDEEDK